MRLRPLAAALAGLLVATLVSAGPAAAGSLLDRANRALQQAGDKIEKAAEETGREVQDFLVDNPALNRDLVDLGKRLGLPGFDKTRPESGAGLIAAPSPTAPGGTVELAAVGLPGNTKVTVAAGPSVDKAKQIARGTTSDRGGLQITVKAPEDTAPGSTLVFVVETADARVRVVSEPITVVAADDIVTVIGTLSNEGVGCQALRGDDGVLYTLATPDLAGAGPGDRVKVVGTVAEVSTCMQGTTLSVISITAAK